MRLWILGSGSRGNAIVVESGECRVLVDAGFGPRILQRRMQAAGIAPESIEACVITHEHADHVAGAASCARRWRWPLFATPGTISESRLASLADAGGAAPVVAGATVSFSALDVTTFRTPHDAAEPIGVVVTERHSGARAAVCTDIGYASASVHELVRDVDLLVIESNHDEEMLRNGRYTPWLKRRIASKAGHLSNRACSELLRDSVTARLRQIVLAHLSEENNTPKMAFDTMRPVLRKSAFQGRLSWAAQDSVVGPFTASACVAEAQLRLEL